jgi:uncharacterized delta-60 repeat protein
MKKLLLLSLLSSFLFSSLSAQVNIQWQVRYTSTGANVDRSQDMFLDAQGNVYVTGIGRGASGNFDYVTIKYNAAGAQQWLAEYNGPGNGLDEAHAITVDTAGNVYVTGWSYGGAGTGYDYATVKYNPAGVQQWAARYNNTTNGTDEAWDVGVDYNGNVFVTGSSDGSGVNSAAATIKYNSAGVQQNAVRFEGAGSQIDAGFAIYVEPVSGAVHITGYTFQSTSADFNFITIKYNNSMVQQWATMYNGPANNYDEARSITVDAAGNVYVTGYSQTAVLTDYDYSTVKYNSSGVQQWAQNYNGTGNDYDRSNAIRLDAAGNVYVTGKSVGAGSSAEDVYTIKYNNAGTTQWGVRYNGTSNGYDEGKAIAIDTSGNVYVTGYSFTSGLNNDYLTIKYDSTGAQQWLTKYNGTGNNTDQAAAIEVDDNGNVFITGFSKGSGSVEDYETIKYCQLEADGGTDATICNGASTTLNASAAGAVAFSWLPLAGLSDPTSASPVASPTTTTTYTVSITNGSGCVDIDTVRITVLPLPSPSITASGPTSFCLGDSVTLTAASASEYLWSTSVNDTLQSITVYSSGTYSVTIGNGFGCNSSASQSVTVFSLPPIDAGMNDSVCLSTNANLMASGGVSYIWHPGATLSDSTIANPVAGPTTTTTYTVIGTATGGCQNTDSVTITILGNPGVPTITKTGDTLTCNPAASAYQWYLNGTPISGATAQTHIYIMNGNYYVEVFNNLGCSTVSTPISINDVGVSELEKALGLAVYPNPFNTELVLEIENAERGSSVKLMNVTGQVLYSETITLNGAYRSTITADELSKGIYFLQITSNQKSVTKKIVKN